MEKNILLLGTMDTKGREFGYVKERIMEKGHRTIVVDAGILGTPLLAADISREKVAQAAGTDIQDLISQGKEGVAIELMTRGASSLVQELYYSGQFDGIFALGGSMGTSLATAVMRSLPLGIPKVMVSTMASSDTRPYLDNKDIVMVPSVTDIVGLNRLTKRVLTMAEKLNKAVGPTAVIIPKRGISGYGKGWEEFYDGEADFAFFNILKRRLKPEIRVVEVDSHINDRLFAERATDLLDELMHKAV